MTTTISARRITMDTPLLREQHLEWCRRRALEYAERGELANAITSMGSDMEKHPATADYPIVLFTLGMNYVLNNDREGVIQWIKGFK